MTTVKNKPQKPHKTNIQTRTGLGNCFVISAQIVIAYGFGSKRITGVTLPPFAFIGIPRLTHGEVTGYGEIAGIRYGHGWVEDDLFVYDYSNGNSLWCLKETYYKVGGIVKSSGKFAQYTPEQAAQWMTKTGHYGAWELDCKI